ncbi:MAG: peptidylprolyl isomerase [Verrucomicrobiota bacterium]
MKPTSWLFFIVLALVLFYRADIQAQIIDGVAAVVNDKVITFSEVKRLVDPTEAQLREMHNGLELMEKVKEARLTTLKALVERELIIQDFDKQGFFIPENVIEDQLQHVIKTQYGGDRNALIRTLQANGVPLANFKQELRDQMIVQAMRGKNVAAAVIVSPFKIEQYYQDNIKQFTRQPEVKLKLLFLRRALFKEARTDAKGVTEEVDPQFALAQELHRKIETGVNFSELARTYSEGAQREKGGDWGWVAANALREDLSKTAFNLKPGQLSEIISTEDGYYLLMVEDKRGKSVIPLNEVRDQIEQTLLQEERAHLQQEWIDGLRSRAFIKMF